MKLQKKYLCAALTLPLVHPALAQAPDDSLTVWASPLAASPSIVNHDTIQTLDKQDVAKALALIPGVVLQKSGNRNELSVNVRGFNSRQVPLFFDGVPIYVPYDGNLDLGRFLTSNISALEVSKGYSSLLQGPNQMGGAINITSRKPEKPLQADVGYRQGWSRGADNAYDAHASLAAKNDLGYFQITGSQLKQRFLGLPHGYDNTTAGGNGRMINSAADDRQAILKLGFTPRGTDNYTLTYIHQEGEKNNPPYSGSGSQKSRYWQWPQYDKESYYYQGTTQLAEGYTLKSRLYRDNFKNTLMMYNSLKDLQQRSGNYSHYDDYSNGAGLQLAIDLRQSDLLSFALNWKQDVHREKGAPDAPYDRYKDRTWSLATEYQWSLLEDLDVVAGASYDWRDSLQGMKYEKKGDITYYDANHQRAFNWEIMGKYTLDNADTLSLSYADRSRFPTLKERYTTSKPSRNQIALVNPGLKPERARSIDLTYNGRLSRDWRYEASAYYNRVSDAILSHNLSADLIQNRNSGRVDYLGVDLSLQGQISEMSDIGLKYSLIHASLRDLSNDKITQLPTQTLVGWISVKPLPELTLTLSEEARSASYSDSSGQQKAPGFALTHLRAEFELGHGFSVNASVNNLFDTQYYYSEGFIEEGRNYWTGIAYTF
ncbi:TonB-dependent receptor plug domain-containing protein [Edwardsiella tarda]|uniref:TonB-dependent receptor plug domain-containing protein n=1 Tax=Edwardsiella tarda TaxID=636 RepID=UPI00083A6E93|nr:TonB-dependent receptor [Edwardsiella tarda]